MITVTLKNRGSSTLYLPKALTPLYTPDDHLMTNVFRLIDDQGRSPAFIGRYVHVLARDADAYYARIAPGEELSHELNLTSDYSLVPGNHYTISYEQPYAHGYQEDEHGNISDDASRVRSNEIDIVASMDVPTSQSRARPQTSSGQCTEDQMKAVGAARSESYQWVTKALSHLKGLYFVELGKNEFGTTTYSGRLKQDNIYDYWIGPADNNGAPYLSRPSYTNYWRDNDDFVMMNSLSSVALRIGGESYLCGCPSTYPWNTAAWTQTAPRNIIHLCDYFFSLPTSDGAYDSQRLTIIHEISHFVDSWGAETADYAYGRDEAHAHTTSNREQAVRNADNLMYFVGSTNQ